VCVHLCMCASMCLCVYVWVSVSVSVSVYVRVRVCVCVRVYITQLMWEYQHLALCCAQMGVRDSYVRLVKFVKQSAHEVQHTATHCNTLQHIATHCNASCKRTCCGNGLSK